MIYGAINSVLVLAVAGACLVLAASVVEHLRDLNVRKTASTEGLDNLRKAVTMDIVSVNNKIDMLDKNVSRILSQGVY